MVKRQKEMASNYRILIDSPTFEPVLGFDKYAKALAELIITSPPRFAIGIFGGWGSGKTTLMHAIQNELTSNPGRTICVDFNAWRYEKENNLLIPLLETLKDSLVIWAKENNYRNEKKFIKVKNKLSDIITSLVAGFSMEIGTKEVLKISLDASKSLDMAEKLEERRRTKNTELSSNYYRCYKALNETFQSFQKDYIDSRIVIFVDDLDRCLPNNALLVLEAIKLFFDTYGFIFVVGIDQSVLECYIDKTYSKIETTNNGQDTSNIITSSGKDYLKKIFQIPIYLPIVSISHLDEYLVNLSKDLPADQKNDILRNIKQHAYYLINDNGFNPREIKRYINSYTLMLKMNPSVSPKELIALKTIEFNSEWREISIALSTYGELFFNSFRNSIFPENQQFLLMKNIVIPSTFREYITSGPGRVLLLSSKINSIYKNGLIDKNTKYQYLLRTLDQIYSLLNRNIQLFETNTDVENIKQLEEYKGVVNGVYNELINSSNLNSKRTNYYHDEIQKKLKKILELINIDNSEDVNIKQSKKIYLKSLVSIYKSSLPIIEETYSLALSLLKIEMYDSKNSL